MYYLLRCKIIAGALFILCSGKLKAQYVEINRPERDRVPYFFGISFSYHNSYLFINKSATFYNTDSVLSINSGKSSGIALGLIGTLRLNEWFFLRVNPQLILGSSKSINYTLKYPVQNQNTEKTLLFPTTIFSFPFQVKFMSDRIENFRVYLLGGVKIDLDLSNSSQDRISPTLPQFRQTDFGIEAGIGFHFYLPFVTVTPELKLSYGLSNYLIQNNQLLYTRVMDAIQTRSVVFSIILED